MKELTSDIEYQDRFRRAFIGRRLHPSTEIKTWEYAIGKPVDQIEVAATMSMDNRLEADRALFAELSVEDLEELARDNERLLAKARTMAQRQRLPPAAATLPGAPIDSVDCTTGEPAEQSPSTDVDDA